MLNSRLGADEGTQSLAVMAYAQLGNGYTTAHSLLIQHTLMYLLYMHYYHSANSYRSLQVFGILYITYMLLSSCRTLVKQAQGSEISNPGCIELLPAEKLASHVDEDCQFAAAGRRL